MLLIIIIVTIHIIGINTDQIETILDSSDLFWIVCVISIYVTVPCVGIFLFPIWCPVTNHNYDDDVQSRGTGIPNIRSNNSNSVNVSNDKLSISVSGHSDDTSDPPNGIASGSVSDPV